jgi:nuclear transcription Y subunit beta
MLEGDNDRYLPIANVARIIKNALPENSKVGKCAKEVMQNAVSEFVVFVSSEGIYH